MDQELANCNNNVYNIATYNRRQFVSRSRSTILTNLPKFRFDCSLQKRMKQWIKLTMSTILWTISKRSPKFWETSSLLRTVMNNKMCYLWFLSCNLKIYHLNNFSFSIRVKQHEMENLFFLKFNPKTLQ